VQRVVAVELGFHLFHERRIGVQARHFVFVLIGHELEAVACHRFGQAGEAFGLVLLLLAHALDQHRVLLRIGSVLVGSQERGPALDHFIQRLGHARGCRGSLLRGDHAFDRRRVCGHPAAPQERGLVHLYRGTVELDGLLDGLRRHRHQTTLVGEAEHEHVGGDGIAHQGRGYSRGFHELGIALAHAFADGALERLRGKGDVGRCG